MGRTSQEVFGGDGESASTGRRHLSRSGRSMPSRPVPSRSRRRRGCTGPAKANSPAMEKRHRQSKLVAGESPTWTMPKRTSRPLGELLRYRAILQGSGMKAELSGGTSCIRARRVMAAWPERSVRSIADSDSPIQHAVGRCSSVACGDTSRESDDTSGVDNGPNERCDGLRGSQR